VNNPQYLLHAGQFARVQVAATQLADAIVLPQRSIQELQGKYYVWIVDAAGKHSSATCKWDRVSAMAGRCSRDSRPAMWWSSTAWQRLKPGSAVHATPLVNAREADKEAPGSRT